MSKNGPHNLPDGCREKKKPKNGPFFEKQGDFISKVVFYVKNYGSHNLPGTCKVEKSPTIYRTGVSFFGKHGNFISKVFFHVKKVAPIYRTGVKKS